MPSCSIAASTVHLRQSDMPVWARGTIWNCRDPEDCRPLVDAHDTHSDSLRPAAFAEWAEFIGWRDADIVHQLNGGGLRAYHDSLSLDTVLAFHHGSEYLRRSTRGKAYDNKGVNKL